MDPWYLSHLVLWGAGVAVALGSLRSAFGVVKALKNVYHYKLFNLDLKSAVETTHKVSFYQASKRLIHVIGFLTYSSLQFEMPPSLHLFLWTWFLVLTLTVNYVLSLTLVTEDLFRVDLAAGAGGVCTLVEVAGLLMVEAVYVSGLNQTNRRTGAIEEGYMAGPGRSADLSNVNTVLQPPVKLVHHLQNSTDKTRMEAMETNNATTRRQNYLDIKRPDAPELTFRMDMGSNEPSLEEMPQEKEGKGDERVALELITLMMMIGAVVAAFWGAYMISERGNVQFKSCFLMWLVGIGLDIPLRLLLSFFLSLLGLLPNFSRKYISLDYDLRNRDLSQFSKAPKRQNLNASEFPLSPTAQTNLLIKDQGNATPEQTGEDVHFPSLISEDKSPGRPTAFWPALIHEKSYNPSEFSRYDDYVEKLQLEEMTLKPLPHIFEDQQNPDPEEVVHEEKEIFEIIENQDLKQSEPVDETEKSSISEQINPSSDSNASSSLSEISEDCHIEPSGVFQSHDEEEGVVPVQVLSQHPDSFEAIEVPQSYESGSYVDPVESAVIFPPENRPESDIPEVIITTEIDPPESSSPREFSSSQTEESASGPSQEAGEIEHSEPEPADLDTADMMRKQSPEAIVPHITFGDQFPIPTENERFSDIFSTARGTQAVFPSQYMEDFPEPQRPHFSPQTSFPQSRPSLSRPPKPKTASRISPISYDQKESQERSFRRSQSSSNFSEGRLRSQSSEGMKTPRRRYGRELAEISSDSEEDISVISPMNPTGVLKPHKSQSSFLRFGEQRPASPEATDGGRYQVPSRPGTTLFEPEGSPISADGQQFRFSSGRPMPEAEYEEDAFNRAQSPAAANAEKVSFRTSETSTSRTALQPLSYGREAERQRIASELLQLARTQGYKEDVNLKQLSHILAARVDFHKKYGYQASDFESPYEEILWQMMKDDPVPKRLTALGDEDQRSQLAKLKSLYDRYKAGSSRPGGALNRHDSLSSIDQRSRKVTPEMSHTRKKLYQMMSSRSEANFQLPGEPLKVRVMNGPIREDPTVEDHSTPNNQKRAEAWK